MLQTTQQHTVDGSTLERRCSSGPHLEDVTTPDDDVQSADEEGSNVEENVSSSSCVVPTRDDKSSVV